MKHTLNMIERMETAVANSTVTFKHNLKDSPTPWSWSTDTTKEHRGFVTRLDYESDIKPALELVRDAILKAEQGTPNN